MVQVTRRAYRGWDALVVECGELELALVPQVGGRILGVSWRGRELAYTHAELEGRVEPVFETADPRARKRELGFLYWGGDKTWLAPQGRWNDALPFLDLDSGPYEARIVEGGPRRVVIAMTSPVCRESGMRLTRTVAVGGGEPGWSLTHRMHNCSPVEAEWALWDVMQIRQPALVEMPLSARSKHPDGIKVFAEEGEALEARDEVIALRGRVARIDCGLPRKFKYGTDAQAGWLRAVIETEGGSALLHKTFPAFPRARFAHDCSAEVFNSAEFSYCELELHGPLVRLAPGESFEMTERAAVADPASNAWRRKRKDAAVDGAQA